jgi:metal iron transporter
VAGCFITLADTLLIIFFYRPTGSMIGLRIFESFIVLLVVGVAVCFCIQLSFLRDTDVGQVFRGFLPSATVVQGNGFVPM